MRPFIGALFALALYFFISGDLVSVFQLPNDEQSQRYFFAGLGFLAGFSERFAQDMVAQGKSAGVAQAPLTPQAPVRT
jgi:cell division protein FtsW (lipid II flippase)